MLHKWCLFRVIEVWNPNMWSYSLCTWALFSHARSQIYALLLLHQQLIACFEIKNLMVYVVVPCVNFVYLTTSYLATQLLITYRYKDLLTLYLLSSRQQKYQQQQGQQQMKMIIKDSKHPKIIVAVLKLSQSCLLLIVLLPPPPPPVNSMKIKLILL